MPPPLVAALIVLCEALTFTLTLPVLAFFNARLGGSPLFLGVLFALVSAPKILTNPVFGRLSDRVGRRPILAINTVGTLGGSVLWALSGDLLLLAASRAVIGVFSAQAGLAQSVVADSSTRERRAAAMGLLGAAFGVALAIGPPLGGWVAAAFGYAAVGWLCAALQLISLALIAFVLRETRPAAIGSTDACRFAGRTAVDDDRTISSPGRAAASSTPAPGASAAALRSSRPGQDSSNAAFGSPNPGFDPSTSAAATQKHALRSPDPALRSPAGAPRSPDPALRSSDPAPRSPAGAPDSPGRVSDSSGRAPALDDPPGDAADFPREVLRNPRVWRLLAVLVLLHTASNAVFATLSLYVESRFAYGAGAAGAVFGVIGVIAILVQGGLIRPAVQRFGEIGCVLAGVGLMAAGFGLLAAAQNTATFWTGLVVSSIGIGLISPCISALLTRAVADHQQGGVAGWQQSALAIGRSVGNLAGGFCFARIGPAGPPALGVLLGLLALPGLLALRGWLNRSRDAGGAVR